MYQSSYYLDHLHTIFHLFFHVFNFLLHVPEVPLKSHLTLEGFTQAMKVIFRTLGTPVINYLEHLRPSVGTAGGPILVPLIVL